MSISVGSGTLYMTGATGSGTSQLSLGPIPLSQIDADLASLTYVPAAGATSDTVQIQVSPPAPVSANREIPITITPGPGGPTLSEPGSETVTAYGSIAVSGSYSDNFAQHNPGELFIGISDSTGTLTATDASGAAVAGSGSNSIGLSTSYVDVNAILASLHYTAGGGTGSDTIRFQVWNQAGAETTAASIVTIDSAASNTALVPADFAARPVAAMPTAAPGIMGVVGDVASHPPGIAALFSH